MFRCCKFLSTVILTSLLASCGGTSNVEPPAELVQFTPEIHLQDVWRRTVGVGTDEYYFHLYLVEDHGSLYIPDVRGRLTALTADRGRMRWVQKTELPISGGLAVGKDILVFGTNKADLVVVNQSDGSERWRVALSSEILARPTVAEDVILVLTIDGKWVALDTESGQEKWLYERLAPALTLRGGSAPGVYQDLAIAGLSSGRVVAVERETGLVVWEREVAIPKGRTDLERMVDITADVLVIEDKVFTVAYQGRVMSLDARTGQPHWQYDLSSYQGMGYANNTLYVSDANSYVWSFNAATGLVNWTQEQLKARQLTAPVVVGDYVVVGDIEGYLHWLAVENGRFMARVRVAAEPINSLLVVDDIVYSFANNGRVAATRVKG